MGASSVTAAVALALLLSAASPAVARKRPNIVFLHDESTSSIMYASCPGHPAEAGERHRAEEEREREKAPTTCGSVRLSLGSCAALHSPPGKGLAGAHSQHPQAAGARRQLPQPLRQRCKQHALLPLLQASPSLLRAHTHTRTHTLAHTNPFKYSDAMLRLPSRRSQSAVRREPQCGAAGSRTTFHTATVSPCLSLFCYPSAPCATLAMATVGKEDVLSTSKAAAMPRASSCILSSFHPTPMPLSLSIHTPAPRQHHRWRRMEQLRGRGRQRIRPWRHRGRPLSRAPRTKRLRYTAAGQDRLGQRRAQPDHNVSAPRSAFAGLFFTAALSSLYHLPSQG